MLFACVSIPVPGLLGDAVKIASSITISSSPASTSTSTVFSSLSKAMSSILVSPVSNTAVFPGDDRTLISVASSPRRTMASRMVVLGLALGEALGEA